MSSAKPKTFNDLYREAQEHDDYRQAGLVQQLTEEIFQRMEELRMTRAELARRLGSSPAYITKILRGNANFTLGSLVKLARALDSELRVGLSPTPRLPGERSAGTATGSLRASEG